MPIEFIYLSPKPHLPPPKQPPADLRPPYSTLLLRRAVFHYPRLPAPIQPRQPSRSRTPIPKSEPRHSTPPGHIFQRFCLADRSLDECDVGTYPYSRPSQQPLPGRIPHFVGHAARRLTLDRITHVDFVILWGRAIELSIFPCRCNSYEGRFGFGYAVREGGCVVRCLCWWVLPFINVFLGGMQQWLTKSPHACR